MNTLIPYTIGFLSGFVCAFVLVSYRTQKRNCSDYLRDEGGYEAVESEIDTYLEELLSDRSADA